VAKAKKLRAKAKRTKTTTEKPTREKSAESTSMAVGITKEYPRGKNVCRVAFSCPRIAAPDAKNVSVVGDFNDWNVYAHRMRRLSNGDFAITLELKPGREYEFQYLVDGMKWKNDRNAAKYVKSPCGDGEISVFLA
jgi:1,4-alpha-glucan branching enzyme